MNRTEKQEMVGSLAEIFNSSQVGFLVDYRGLNVAEVTELRRVLHESAASMRVLKNRIAKRAIGETPFAPLEEHLSDTRALIFADDPVAPAKAVGKYLSDNEKLRFIAGVLITASGGSVLDASRMKALGNLPSREELLTKLVFVLNANQTSLVRTLNEIPAKFVRTLAAIVAARGGAPEERPAPVAAAPEPAAPEAAAPEAAAPEVVAPEAAAPEAATPEAPTPVDAAQEAGAPADTPAEGAAPGDATSEDAAKEPDPETT